LHCWLFSAFKAADKQQLELERLTGSVRLVADEFAGIGEWAIGGVMRRGSLQLKNLSRGLAFKSLRT